MLSFLNKLLYKLFLATIIIFTSCSSSKNSYVSKPLQLQPNKATSKLRALKHMYINSHNAPLHVKPNKNSKVIRNAQLDEKVYVYKYSSDSKWALVNSNKYTNLRWISSILLSPKMMYPKTLIDDRSLSSCEGRGLRYFQDIGSYPSLSDGRSVFKVVAERCSRSQSAF